MNEVIPTAFSHIRGFAQMDAYKRNFCHCKDSLYELDAKIQNLHDNMRMNTLGMNGIFTTPRLWRRCRHHRKGISCSRLQDGIGAVGAVFEQEFLGLGEFSGLVLAEGVTAPADSWGRDGNDEVGIVRAVVEGYEPHIRPIGLVRALYMPD